MRARQTFIILVGKMQMNFRNKVIELSPAEMIVTRSSSPISMYLMALSVSSLISSAGFSEKRLQSRTGKRSLVSKPLKTSSRKRTRKWV